MVFDRAATEAEAISKGSVCAGGWLPIAFADAIARMGKKKGHSQWEKYRRAILSPFQLREALQPWNRAEESIGKL